MGLYKRKKGEIDEATHKSDKLRKQGQHPWSSYHHPIRSAYIS